MTMGLGRQWRLSRVLTCSLWIAYAASGAEVQFSDSRISVSGDGKHLLFSSPSTGHGDIYRFDIERRAAERLTHSEEFEGWPGYLPDSDDFIFSKGATDKSAANLFVYNMASKTETALTSGTNCDRFGSVSKDGSKIAFARSARLRPYSMGGTIWDDWDIYLMNAGGGNVVRITTNHFRQLDPPQFIDDDRLAFAADAGASGQVLYWIELKAPNQLNTMAASGQSVSAEPSICAENQKEVFISNRVSREEVYDFEIWTTNPEGKELRQISSLKSFLA